MLFRSHAPTEREDVNIVVELPRAARARPEDLLALQVRSEMNPAAPMVPLRELVTVEPARSERNRYRKNLQNVTYVVADVAGVVESPVYAILDMNRHLAKLDGHEFGGTQPEVKLYNSTMPFDDREPAIKWDGEWQVTYETFRDMGAAYAVGLILIYLLVVAQFKSYLTPLVIMAPIPLTLIGVMPGHALLQSQFTATSMIGMIALAGIIVRNSILLVDFIELQVRNGLPFRDAVVQSAAVRAQPIALTGLAAMIGAFFILDDPIFNGLAISLIFGILVSTVLTLVVIPTLYFMAYQGRLHHLEPKGNTP